VNWILDSDIAGDPGSSPGACFDTVDHEHRMRFVEHRIADPRVSRLIRKWLQAGVMEDEAVTPGTVGTPQGAVISPLLANIYRHFVFDLWAEQWRKRHPSPGIPPAYAGGTFASVARGTVIIVRYADDIVVGFEHEADARRFLDEMRERLAAFALTLHGEKTRLIRFGRSAARDRKARGEGKPEAFNFLGFTHICGRNRAGGFQLRRRADQQQNPCGVSLSRDPAMAENASATRPERSDHVATDHRTDRTLAPQTTHHTPLAGRTLRRQIPKVGAVCGKSARTVLCGGRAVMRVPTAIVRSRATEAPSMLGGQT